MDEIKEKLLQFWQDNDDLLKKIGLRLAKVSVILLTSFALASTVSSFFVGVIAKDAIKSVPLKKTKADNLNIRKTLNYRQLRKSVTGRNIFNSEGELPDETDVGREEKKEVVKFNIMDKCSKSSLNLELQGIIYSADPSSSLATIREKGYDIADIYRAGDVILGNDNVVVYLVEKERVILNNDGVKECLEIKGNSKKFANSPKTSIRKKIKSTEEPTEALDTVQLNTDFVTEALGPGFSRILESGRLVPYSKDGGMLGFKLIGVKSGSLWNKIGLNNGDVITNVNGSSMAQPDKGFTLYEALQNDQEIRLDFLRKGKSPTNISIEIR